MVTTPYIVNWIKIGTLSLQSYVDTNMIRHGQITLAENCGNSISMISQLIRLITENSPKYISDSLSSNSIVFFIIKKELWNHFQLFADCLTIFPVYRAAKLFATYSTHPVYFYKFTFQGRRSFNMLNDKPYGKTIYFTFLWKRILKTRLQLCAILYFRN